MANKHAFLKDTIQHFDITKQNVIPVVEAMRHMAYSAARLVASGGDL